VPTGIAELDAVLPARGLPRGRLAEIVGARGSWGGGKATVARRIVEAALGRGDWVAYIDATRTLAARDWAHLGLHEGLWVVRPQDPARAAWCADVILRSGAFALLVLDGAPPLPRPLAVRLTHLARESDAALLVIAADGAAGGTEPRATMLGGALRLRVQMLRRRRRGKRWISTADGTEIPRLRLGMTDLRHPSRDQPDTREGRSRSTQDAARSSSPDDLASTLRITVEKGATSQRIEVPCAVGVARRLCTHPEVPDRRGVARRAGRSSLGAVAAAAGGTDGGDTGGGDAGGRDAPTGGHGSGVSGGDTEPGGRAFTRSRRCAEPEYGRESGATRAVRAARSRARAGR
jgi:hypothetical protein